MTAQILVVDDEPDMKALVLQKFRHQIGDGAVNLLFASDGIEALAMLEANGDIDMVVADINMPRMDGLTLLHKLPGKRRKRFNDHRVGLWRHEQYSRCNESRRV